MWSDLLKFPENAVLMVYGILSGPDHKGENRLGTGTETESGTGSSTGFGFGSILKRIANRIGIRWKGAIAR